MIAGNACPNFFHAPAGWPAITMIYFTYAFVKHGAWSAEILAGGPGVPLPFMSYGGHWRC